ncbi:unnamed protein product, partial [Rotaria socialis]
MYLCDMLALIGFKRIIAGLAVVTVVVIVAVVVPVVIVENLSKQTAVIPTVVTSNYTSELTNSSQTFTRYGSTGTFYYQAIQINVSVTGNYSFACFSAANAYGYLYVNTFDPSNVNVNLIAQNSGTGGNFQFYITIVLQPGSTYILVVTTYAPGVTTVFSITASGPTSIGLLATTTRTSITSESTIPTITAPP